MAKYYDLNIPGSEVQRRLDLASHNVLAFDGILDVPVTASDELITSAESYQILYAPNGGRGEMLMSIGGTYYRNFRLQSAGKTYLDSSWYNEDGQIRKDRLFLNGAARDIYAYAAGSFGKVERDGVDGQDGITPHVDPTTKHWMIGDEDTGIVAEGQDGQDGTDGIDGNDGKSAFDIWLENGHSGNISDFLAWMKDTSSMIGPKFAATTADCLMVNDTPTLYFVPNGTTFNVYMADSEGQGVSAHSLATGVPGDITNYAGIYDISQDKAVNGVPSTYGNLSEALGAITDTTKKKGGMTIKFIQGTGADAKYVQYRLLRTTFPSTYSADDWQGVDDVATEDSNNLVTSGGVVEYLDETLYSSKETIDIPTSADSNECWINGSNTWESGTTNGGALIACRDEWKNHSITVKGSSEYISKIAFLKSNTITNGESPNFCDGESGRRQLEGLNAIATFTIPTDCNYIWFATSATIWQVYTPTAYRPKSVTVTYGDGIITQQNKRIGDIEQAVTTDIDIDLSEIKDESWYYWIDNSGNYSKTQGDSTGGSMGIFYHLECKAKQIYIEGSDWYLSKIAFLKSPKGETPDYCNNEDGRREIQVGANETFSIPSDCTYIWFAISARTLDGSYKKDAYRPKKVTLKGVTIDKTLFNSVGNNCNHNKRFIILNGSKTFDYIRCQSQESIPVGSSAVSYADFIAQWDTFIEQHSELFTKSEIINSTTGNYPIYKYVYTPTYYEKTIFLTAGMHGDEYEGFWGLLRCMQYILDTNNNNKLIKYIRNTCRVIIIPVLNPYGVQNKKRYSTSQSVDQNYNFDVAWGKCENMSGAYPFYYAEPKAVKIVCDEYDGEIAFHIDFHTDPYNGEGLPANTSKCNYIEADEDSIIFPAAYELTIAEREHIKNDLHFQNISSNFVVWTNKAATSFRYMEWVRHIPSIIVEITTYANNKSGSGFAGDSGSAAVMKATVDWYLNCICMMLTNVL